MKVNKSILISLLLFTVISLGVVSAADDANSTDDALQLTSDINEDLTEDMQTETIDDELTASSEDIVEETASDNVTVEVSNVYKGQNATISVAIPEATGTVEITVGENIYTPEFIGGVATQNVSQYSIGLNNVTIKYNSVIKQTGFKVLDGVITNETFFDYYEYIQGVYVTSDEVYKRYKMFDFIPEGAILDFRGLIDISNVDYASHGRGLTVISSTNDVFIKGKMIFNSNCNISNINFTGISIRSNSYLTNSTIGQLEILGDCINISNVTVKGKTKFVVSSSNILIQDCILSEGITSSYDIYIYSDTYSNITVKNCIGAGDFFNQDMRIEGGIIENNVIDGFLYLWGSNIVVRNNTINADYEIYLITERPPHQDSFLGSLPIYAIDLVSGSGTIVNNTIYTYGSDYAVYIYGTGNVIANNSLFSNRFGDNAVTFAYVSFENKNVVINNTPDQIPITITNTKRILYDEKVTISAGVLAAGNVTIDVNGKRCEIELVDGIANLTINEYHSGTNMIRVYYSDVENDIYGYKDATFFVEKVDVCPVVLEYDDVIVGKVSSVNVILPDDANGTIELSISNSTHSIKIVQNANGSENIIKLLDLAQGDYLINATFTSDKYVTNSSVGMISFVNIPVYKLTSSNVAMSYNDGSKYKVLLTKDGKTLAGETVKITFNGKTSNVKTDKNGYATLTVSNLPGKYTVTASYKGQSVKNTIQVKQNLKASKVTVKKSAKSFVLKATLNKLKGKKLTFKFNGKTYTAKTDKKGVAKVTIKKNIIKKLKKGKKYTFTVKYVSNTVKSQVTVK